MTEHHPKADKHKATAKEAQKDTIYVDVDDEITNIIDKVKQSDHKIVALVLPKRATVLQSAVNMKLLKRSADRSKKKLVLITSEAGLLPLAGAAGLHVAKNLQSKPEIPDGPVKDEAAETLVHEEDLAADDQEPELDDKKSIGELAGAAAAGDAAGKALSADETIQMDDDQPAAASGKSPRGKKDKKLKVPNFERFRKWLILGGIGLVILIIGGWFAFTKMPKAKITIQTDSSDTTANLTFTANTTNKTFDLAGKTVPAQLATNKKTDSSTVPATGQKDIGNKATGTVTIRNCEDTDARSLSAGSSFTSSSGKVFTADSGVQVPGGKFSGGGSNCTSNSVTVNVTAAATGDSYNIAATSYTSAQLNGKFSINGSNMTGGTTNVVKVVSQQDVDNAKNKLTTNNNAEAVKAELKSTLQKDGMFAIDSSFVANNPEVSSNPAVGSQAENATVTVTTTYTMLGVDKDSLEKLVEDNLKEQIDEDKQMVQSSGIDTATFSVAGKDNPTVTMQTTATIGPKIDTEALKKEIAGKKKNATKEIIQNRPSIKNVVVDYSPFWVIKTPGDPNKVTIVFEKASN